MKNIITPAANILGSTKFTFPSGIMGRRILAHKYLDALYVIAIRIGTDMTKKYLLESALDDFFVIFEKVNSKSFAHEKVCTICICYIIISNQTTS